jgi:predicted nucleotidyltransferase
LNLFQKFLKVFHELNSEGVEYILIGGFAVIIYGLPRLTQDIDIMIKLSSQNVEKLQKALNNVFRDDSIKEITFEELKKYAVVRYGTPDGFYIDILAKIGDIASYESLESEIRQIEGVGISIATPKALLQLKKDSMRPSDQQDANFLKEFLKKNKS